MCGIAGFTWKDEELLRAMTDLLAHRGPDGEGAFSAGGISLGHRRLAIIDLSARARQPFFNEDRSLAVVCNGEIYNYRELRRDLAARGHAFRSDSDSEVIPHLFEEYKTDAFAMLDGMFALALYDTVSRELFLAVDHLAIKNVYYAICDEGLIFASEIKAIIGAGKIAASVNDRVMRNIVTYGYNPDTQTPFSGVRMLSPGTFLKWEDGNARTFNYSRFTPDSAVFSEGELLTRIDAAVRKMLVADVPVAVIASGGLDSSIVAAFARKHRPDTRIFSIGFTKEDNEFRYSRMLADALGLDYTEIVLEDFDIAADMPRILYHQETPQDTGSMLPKWYLAQEISKRGYKVVLGGSGADETWCGYTRHAGICGMVDSLSGDALARAYFEKYIMKQQGDPLLLNAYLSEKPWYDLCSYFDVFHELPFYHNVRLDKMFMAWGIEYRLPFLDKELVQLSLNTPLAQKLFEGERKYLLRRVMKGILPEEIVRRPKQPLKIAQVVEDRMRWQEYIFGVWKNVHGFGGPSAGQSVNA